LLEPISKKPLPSRFRRPFIPVFSGWQDWAPKHSGVSGVPSFAAGISAFSKRR